MITPTSCIYLSRNPLLSRKFTLHRVSSNPISKKNWKKFKQLARRASRSSASTMRVKRALTIKLQDELALMTLMIKNLKERSVEK
jgi:hypothetical protein